eukprot:scaffold8234_cov248-Pinguiococcus_pyrenoidosus.AAC.2
MRHAADFSSERCLEDHGPWNAAVKDVLPANPKADGVSGVRRFEEEEMDGATCRHLPSSDLA